MGSSWYSFQALSEREKQQSGYRTEEKQQLREELGEAALKVIKGVGIGLIAVGAVITALSTGDFTANLEAVDQIAG